MRNVTTQSRVEGMVDTALNRMPLAAQDITRTITQGMTRKLVEMALKSDMDDIALSKLLVRTGYTLGALHYANTDLLIRQDMAKEAEASGE